MGERGPVEKTEQLRVLDRARLEGIAQLSRDRIKSYGFQGLLWISSDGQCSVAL